MLDNESVIIGRPSILDSLHMYFETLQEKLVDLHSIYSMTFKRSLLL